MYEVVASGYIHVIYLPSHVTNNKLTNLNISMEINSCLVIFH